MYLFSEFRWYFLVMLALAATSAFFSCSEAALFSLQPDDRRALKRGNAGQRAGIELLGRPDRLLTAILFCNLLANVAFFTLSSIITVQLEQAHRRGEAATVALVMLIVLIAVCEMIPKTVGVLFPRALAGAVGLPLTIVVRALDPVMPFFTWANKSLQRALVPNFVREPYLEVSDLERAIELSTADANLAARERSVLQNIVLLTELSAEEVMRPRTNFHAFQPPVQLDDVQRIPPESGYLLVTEPDSEEIAGAVPLKHMPTVPRQHLEHFARPAAYVPWCATVAAVLDELDRQQREVAVVVNELGETIGVITVDDVLETVFEEDSSRSARLLATSSIVPSGEGRWLVTGMTNLRRLSRHFGVPLEPAQSVTVGGLLQELLQRLPAEGDEVSWSGFAFRVIVGPEPGPLKAELTLGPPGGPLP